MTPITVDAGPVERVQADVPTRVSDVVQAEAVERVQLATPSTLSVTIGG